MSSLQTRDYEFFRMLLRNFGGQGPFTGNSEKALALFLLARINKRIKEGRHASALACIRSLLYFLQHEHKKNIENAEWELAIEREATL